MLNFSKPQLADKDRANSFLKQKNYFLCSYNFVDLFVWANHYGTEIAFDEDFMYIKGGNADHLYFLAPIGSGDYKMAVDKLAQYASERGELLRMYVVPSDIKDKIEAIFPSRFDVSESRDTADYIYSAEKLMYLRGKKLHGKRNHINKFLSLYDGRWQYEELTADKAHEFFEYQLEWCADDPDEFLGETCAISTALRNMDALDIKGGLLCLDGRVIAVTLGSESHGDTFTVHFEKADADIAGAYQMINMQFAQRNFDKYAFIDREEDMGIEGLRKAKLSYYPDSITVNYTMLERS